MLNLDQIEALQKRVDALKSYLQIEEKRMEVQEDEKQTHDPCLHLLFPLNRCWWLRANIVNNAINPSNLVYDIITNLCKEIIR